ncbi:MAG TPA: peptide-methionine (R)-S-oxide reductase MsrB [Candidatus Saccharimonadales bacterium]|jgi:peptide-methionine (R)-S-oxide reductase|nr:peptide-methionine (R)-S-oxide reductase MsrB [Candidatus Saccharimonadales bacterium]
MVSKLKLNTGYRQYKTEPPFTGKLLYNKAKGLYVCSACGQALFGSEKKFDSKTGWPSFYDVITQDAVKLMPETLDRINWAEVVCRHCGNHLGHVFDDAPDQPTGIRYCINSAALDFKADKEEIL